MKISRKGRLRIWRYTILNTMEKAVSACKDQDEERKITPFTPLRDRKLHTVHNTAFYSTTECTHAFIPEISRVTMRMQHFAQGSVGRQQGFQTPQRTVQAKHCWAHPSWGWVRSELCSRSRCFLLSGRGKREGRGLHNFPSSLSSNPPSAYARGGECP